MNAAPDPAEITPPSDPAAYGRSRRLGLAFWAVVILCLLSVAAGFVGARFAPKWGFKTGTETVPAATGGTALFETPPADSLATTAPPPEAITPPSAEIVALKARVEALETGQVRTINAAAAALAAASLAEATRGSGSFETELAALERILPMSGEVRALRPFAENGAPSRAALAAEFDAAAAKAAVAARAPGEGAGFLPRLAHALSAIVTIRRVGAGGSGADALLARAGDAMAEGDLEGALKILNGLPPKAGQAMAAWRGRALQRIAVDRQVAAVRALALSDLMAVSRARP
ncbi:MAG: mitofilin family membrane protein [Caulobacter sp.]|nr:mitofilin family membrane protein [Caulobacter sp.]